MTTGPKMFRIDPSSQESTTLEEVDFSQLGLKERSDIQEWVAKHPDILGDDLLIVAKEFSGFDRTSERPDLLAVDSQGTVVVIELKRDDSGADAYWQAVKYASYLRHANADTIVEMLANYADIKKEDAEDRLRKHLGVDDFEILNTEQRIILASHRFAPEATSAVLWLNDKFVGESPITCVQLTPYRDESANALYLYANVIIPLPQEKQYTVQVGSESIPVSGTRPPGTRTKSITIRKSDEVSSFFNDQVCELVLKGLPTDVKPDRHSRYAYGNSPRYYKFYYKRSPWKAVGLTYIVMLFQGATDSMKWRAGVGLEYWEASAQLKQIIESLEIHKNQDIGGNRFQVWHTSDDLDEEFAKAIAGTFRLFIEKVTPVVDEFMEEEANQEDA